MISESSSPMIATVGPGLPVSISARKPVKARPVLTFNPSGLSAYSGESWQNLSDKVSAMPYVKQRMVRPLFAHAAKCEPDKQGRILLPQNLRDFAGLDKNVTVVGCNNHAEFWDSEAWAEINAVETTPENIAAVMEELEF